jgi:hypothetical protein
MDLLPLALSLLIDSSTTNDRLHGMQKYKYMIHAWISCGPFGFHKLVVLSCTYDFFLPKYLRYNYTFCIGKLGTTTPFPRKNTIDHPFF